MTDDVKRFGRYARFEGMTWPLPDRDMADRLTWGTEPLSRNDRLFLSSVMEAYAQLIALPSRTRQARIASIRTALRPAPNGDQTE